MSNNAVYRNCKFHLGFIVFRSIILANTRILLIEDKKKIASFIERGLKEEHYAVDVGNDGERGFFLAEVNLYDLIILDIMLPKKDGISLCRDLRSKKIDTSILILAAKDKVGDKYHGDI